MSDGSQFQARASLPPAILETGPILVKKGCAREALDITRLWRRGRDEPSPSTPTASTLPPACRRRGAATPTSRGSFGQWPAESLDVCSPESADTRGGFSGSGRERTRARAGPRRAGHLGSDSPGRRSSRLCEIEAAFCRNSRKSRPLSATIEKSNIP